MLNTFNKKLTYNNHNISIPCICIKKYTSKPLKISSEYLLILFF